MSRVMPEGERNYTLPAQKNLCPEENFLQNAKIHLGIFRRADEKGEGKDTWLGLTDVLKLEGASALRFQYNV